MTECKPDRKHFTFKLLAVIIDRRNPTHSARGASQGGGTCLLQAADLTGYSTELWGEARAAAEALAARRGSVLLLGTRHADELPLTGGLLAQILGMVGRKEPTCHAQGAAVQLHVNA